MVFSAIYPRLDVRVFCVLCISSESLMTIKVWVKSRLADKALKPVRLELCQCLRDLNLERSQRADLQVTEFRVLDVGCGTGDFLFRCANQITHGLGIDLDQDMVTYARRQAEQNQLSNLSFQCIDAQSLQQPMFDVGVSTLCIHEMPKPTALSVLKRMLAQCSELLIADYTQPKGWFSCAGIELDELMSGHYRHFRRYRASGGIDGYASEIGARCQRVCDSELDGIAIWRLSINQPG